MSAAHRFLVLLVALGVTSACFPPFSLLFHKRAVYFSVAIAPDANDNTPIAVEVVVVYREALVEQILALDARSWFAGREQFLRDHPRDAHSSLWEWIPGQDVANQKLPLRQGAQAVVVFADYVTPGLHRAQVEVSSFELHLRARGFELVPVG